MHHMGLHTNVFTNELKVVKNRAFDGIVQQQLHYFLD
jgi:hypothetical protein